VFPPEAVAQPRQQFLRAKLQGGNGHGDLSTNGKIDVPLEFSQAGEYLLRAVVFASRAGDEPAKMRLQVDGETIRTVDVLAKRSDPQTYGALVHVEAGASRIGVEFINDHWQPEHPDPELRDRNLYVLSLEVIGPLDRKAMAGKKRLDLPARGPTIDPWQLGRGWRTPAIQVLEPLLGRAFRRPVNKQLVHRYVALLEESRQRGESFERAMQLAIEAMLVSPRFLFREGATSDIAESGIHTLDDYELATRLSYFLWSTMPDAALFADAAAGTLRENLDAQCVRMLSDPRADALVRNFGLQWLETPRLDALQPDAELFPEFDDRLRESMRQETFLFLRNVFRSDVPITTLLAADYSFLNERLAKHYGIEGIAGDHFRRVAMPAAQRTGLLTHASVLMVTSHPDRTSPVNRGKWILGHFYNDPPPPPPANVPDLKKTEDSAGRRLTLREQLEIHRADPSCAVCHKRMDEMGFALENFDPLGRWRDQDGSDPVDARGRLPDGRQFTGPIGLRDVLLEDADAFRKAFAEYLLTYALGRGLKYYDACAIEKITTFSHDHGDSFSSMIKAVVRSAPFQQQAASSNPP